MAVIVMPLWERMEVRGPSEARNDGILQALKVVILAQSATKPALNNGSRASTSWRLMWKAATVYSSLILLPLQQTVHPSQAPSNPPYSSPRAS